MQTLSRAISAFKGKYLAFALPAYATVGLSNKQLVFPQMERRNLDTRKRIFKAIAARDAEQAQEWTRKHLIDFQRGYTLARIPMNTPIETHHLE